MSSLILNSVISLGAMGLLFGSGLAYASKKFAVEVDPRVEKINEVLPGANCGGCGYPGCSGLAVAIVNGDAPITACPVGGSDLADKIGDIMGIRAQVGERKIAKVICKGTCNNTKDKAQYEGIKDCRAATMILAGPKSCQYGCLGFGTCVNVCQFGAITIQDSIAVIHKDKCVSCGKCIEVCPKAVIRWAPYDQDVIVECNSKEFGKDVKSKCSVGCIGCKLCVKSCPFEAITFENNLAQIDYSKCTQCMICVEKCPTNAISGDINKRKKATIDDQKCIGCTICKKKCPVDAIEGELKSKHKVNEQKCVGCLECVKKCPKQAINFE
ncbi:electron transport complex protein RnfB [Alkalithermobacter thermoalcaliphilus JW-YL-7 = DSM 7308]|uniref:Ion-translocating oxidoreductase complex subunit B n=1 Tax=Alkalithermobacter thermoalcaliphilus JW-YL-7 = DSM 7308 TaxID=1121328 RepID=A0A150FRE6_CLOPD|nr:electron transport complex, RnfABCDGE type, B subunit [[Clostridium] paradoxum JW-YL-7 = DSM 7308]SHK44315.1 electron transport complex protein RnfB [[Clostridium] paradoxum JW-YL-7 = DSM 7308]